MVLLGLQLKIVMAFKLIVNITDEQEKLISLVADWDTPNAPEGVDRGVPSAQEYIQAKVNEILTSVENRVANVNREQRIAKLVKMDVSKLVQVDAVLEFVKAEDKI